MVIVDAVRTSTGVFGGKFRDIPAHELLVEVIKAILERTQIDVQLIDESIVGCSFQPSDAPNIARIAALRAGLPLKIIGTTVNVNCASSLRAIGTAFQAIRAGEGDVFLVGGVESMSNIPYILPKARFGYRLAHGQFIDVLWESFTDPICNQIMGRTAENLVEEFNISREDQDEFALTSHRKAVAATIAGNFINEIVPVTVRKKARGQVKEEVVNQDEGPNPDITLEGLSQFPAVFKEGGTVTPGNACGLNDCAGAMLIMSEEKAMALGFKPRAYIKAQGWAGLEPERMGLGPVYATPVALKKAGLTLADIDVIELNEAFAAQALTCIRQLNLDQEKVNLNGGAIALGHPVGATGVRIVTTLLNILEKEDKTLGLATMCVGGGLGGAIILERR
ncbi:thiolase family protein [Desulfoscipio gibsoniae]|uniref:thiolase family protein n=1 Tax=Desulfoscipio gibsoniae TaxID=102134 RepID=UPI00307D2C02